MEMGRTYRQEQRAIFLCKNIIKGGDSFCIVGDRNREDGEQKNDLG